MLRYCAILIVSITVMIHGISSAEAGELRGVIKLPKGFQVKRDYNAPGYWKLPNDVISIRPSVIDPRMEMIVLLKGSKLSPITDVKPLVIMESARFRPRVLPVHADVKVTFENKDSVLHNLVPLSGKFMKAQRLGPGASHVRTFGKTGVYKIRCSEVPHMVTTILVHDAPRYTIPDGSGSFSLNNVPTGTYTLQIWYHGEHLYEEPVSIKGKVKVDVLLKKTTK